MGGEAQDRMSFIENPRDAVRSHHGSEQPNSPENDVRRDDTPLSRTTDASTNPSPNQISFLESAIAHIRLGAPGESTVILTEERLEQLGQLLDHAIAHKAKGIILTGPSDDMFSVGADIGAIERIQSSSEGRELASLGQALFDRIEHSPIPVVAAIAGPCIGGALELALACSSRIAADRPSTKLGLPEVKIGIIPGFGGTQRLTRLIGLPRAMHMILNGRIISHREALKLGIVSRIVPTPSLVRTAEAMILEGISRRSRMSLLDKFFTFTPPGRALVRRRCEGELAALHGHYPAPQKALRSAFVGLERGILAGLRAEAESIGELIVTPECKSLVKLFFLTESAKNLGKGARRSLEGLQAVVLGANRTGAALTVDLARREFPVILRDPSPEALTRSMEDIRRTVKGFGSLSEADRSFVINRINPTTGTPAAVGSAQVILDSTVASPAQRKQHLTELAATAQPTSLIAIGAAPGGVSNLMTDIPHPERCLGMQFFPRIHGSSLVEIVRTPATSHRSLALAAALVTGIGRYPIIVEDGAGHLVDRIFAPYLLAALRLVREGHAIEDIDSAATLFGLPIGPFSYLDQQGFDTVIPLLTALAETYGERMAGVEALIALAAQGRRGAAHGGGFYDMSTNRERTPAPAVREILKLPTVSERLAAATILPLLVYPMINEAIRCLDEGVAGSPGIEAGFQIDLASVFGFGFPPFRGGILHYAERVGAKTILHHLHNAERAFGPLFKPTKGLAQRSASGRSVYDPCG